jgi:hypothetical protein
VKTISQARPEVRSCGMSAVESVVGGMLPIAGNTYCVSLDLMRSCRLWLSLYRAINQSSRSACMVSVSGVPGG